MKDHSDDQHHPHLSLITCVKSQLPSSFSLYLNGCINISGEIITVYIIHSLLLLFFYFVSCHMLFFVLMMWVQSCYGHLDSWHLITDSVD